MPEGLTQTKTLTSKYPAGFKSECRPVSFRNRGRLQIGTVAGFTSEYPAGINRNPQTGPKDPKSTVLSIEEEAVIVAFRKHTLLPLDDCLYSLQAVR
jgi:hypothetical protein